MLGSAYSRAYAHADLFCVRVNVVFGLALLFEQMSFRDFTLTQSRHIELHSPLLNARGRLPMHMLRQNYGIDGS